MPRLLALPLFSIWESHLESLKELGARQNPNGLQSLHFDTLTLSPIKINFVERWSKARVISLIGPMMWVSFVMDGKT
jgi:hypothetical protein